MCGNIERAGCSRGRWPVSDGLFSERLATFQRIVAQHGIHACVRQPSPSLGLDADGQRADRRQHLFQSGHPLVGIYRMEPTTSVQASSMKLQGRPSVAISLYHGDQELASACPCSQSRRRFSRLCSIPLSMIRCTSSLSAILPSILPGIVNSESTTTRVRCCSAV